MEKENTCFGISMHLKYCMYAPIQPLRLYYWTHERKAINVAELVRVSMEITGIAGLSLMGIDSSEGLSSEPQW